MKKNGDQLRSLVSQKGSRIEFAVWSSACTPIHRFSPAIPPPLFSLVPVPPLLRIRKYRFPEDVGKKFQGSSSSRRILPLEIITSERSSIIGSNREMQWIMIQETMWRKWRANDSLKCWSVWKKDAGVAWFYFPPFFFFFFYTPFFPPLFFLPSRNFRCRSISRDGFAKRVNICAIVLRYGCPSVLFLFFYHVYLPLLAAFIRVSFFFFGILIFLCEMRRTQCAAALWKDCVKDR